MGDRREPMLLVLPLKNEQPITDRADLAAKARQAAIIFSRTIVINGDGRIDPSGNPELIGAGNSGAAALAVHLDVDVIAVLCSAL